MLSPRREATKYEPQDDESNCHPGHLGDPAGD